MTDPVLELTALPAEKVAFAFSGCVPLTAQPFRELADSEARFEEVLLECDAVLRREAGWSLDDALWKATPGVRVTDLPHNFPLMVALQIAMFELLLHYGIDSGATIGMSCGEVSAAYAAGLIGLTDALRIAANGGRVMTPKANTLRMALIWAPEPVCAEALLPFQEQVSIAAFMEPQVMAVSGDHLAVERVCAELQHQGIRTCPLPFEWGAHTSLLEGCSDFETVLGPLATKPRRRQILSTSLGQWEGSDFGTGHWWRLFRSPVLFAPCVGRMIAEGFEMFLEVGPGSALTDLIPRIGGKVLSFGAALVAGQAAHGNRAAVL